MKKVEKNTIFFQNTIYHDLIVENGKKKFLFIFLKIEIVNFKEFFDKI